MPGLQNLLPEFTAARRVLVIKPSSLGDIVHTLPAVHLLKRRFPRAGFLWLVNPAFAPLLEGNPGLAGLLPFPRESFRGPAGLLRFHRWLRKDLPAHLGRVDLAIDFQGLLRSGLVARASGAPVRIGFSDSREGARFFHNTVIPVNPAAHAIERALDLPRALGMGLPENGTDSPETPGRGTGNHSLPDRAFPEPEAGRSLTFPLPEGTPPASLPGGAVPAGAVLLHPFSRGEGKSLTPAQTVRLCQELAPLPVLLAGRTEPELAARLENLPSRVLNLLNATTLPELIWLIRRSAAVISVDSGPMHIAAALTARVLSLHTWSDPRRVGPWHPGTMVLKSGRLMPAGTADPKVCAARESGFPDSSIPLAAAWARQTLTGG